MKTREELEVLIAHYQSADAIRTLLDVIEDREEYLRATRQTVLFSSALMEAGVYTWEGYDSAVRLYEKWLEENPKWLEGETEEEDQ